MNKPKVFISPRVAIIREISDEYIEELRLKFIVHFPGREEISKEKFLLEVVGHDALIVAGSEVIDEDVMKAAGPTLKVVTVASVGIDQVDLKALKEYNVKLGNAGNVITEAAAEMAITLLLASSRNLINFVNDYKMNPDEVYKQTKTTRGLQKSTIGIVGAGKIGKSIALKLFQFKINQLLYFSRNRVDEIDKSGAQKVSLKELAKRSDYIIVALAYNDETHHIINEDILNSMKSNACIINIGRGATIDNEALTKALQNEKIRGAGLDVTEPEPIPLGHPLFDMKQVVLTPHLGGVTHQVQIDSVDICVANIIAALNDDPMPAEVKL